MATLEHTEIEAHQEVLRHWIVQYVTVTAVPEDLQPAHEQPHDEARTPLEFDSAAAAYQFAAHAGPEPAPEIHHALGHFLWQWGYGEAAVAAFSTALRAGLRGAPYQHALGRALQDQGRRAEAVLLYRDMLTGMASDPATLGALYEALFKAGHFSEARRVRTEVLALKPANAEQLFQLGLALDRMDEPRAARKALRALLEHVPDHERARATLAEWERTPLRRRRQEARESDWSRRLTHLGAAQGAAEKRPEHADTWLALGVALRRVDQPNAAISAYRRAVIVGKPHAQAHYALGKEYAARALWEPAAGEYRAALACGFADRPARVHVRLGRALGELEQPVEAIEEFREALRLSPELGTAHIGWARIAVQQGRYAEAWEHVERAQKVATRPAQPPEFFDRLLEWRLRQANATR